MSEEAAQTAREAKSLQQGLKESLKSREPWDKEVEFQRKNLRRQYLRLLFVYPFTPESRDIETHLWMSTSYQFISKYKERIANLDRAINRAQQQQGSSRQQQRVVEHRKLLQRFSQFLAEEHRFWRQLIVRLHRVFALEDASSALETLRIEVEDPPPQTDGTAPRRSQHLFPLEPEAKEETSSAVSSATPAERHAMIAVMSKALVCLGDIERYKELYNEKGGRPRAGHEEGPSAAPTRGGRGRRGGGASAPQVPRMRNYEKAQQCYEQARLLLPNDGNPSHQLAILATYQRDTFGSLVQYYRSLCVRNRYEPASENMDSILAREWGSHKAKEARRSKDAEAEGATEATPIAPRLRVEAFKEKVIIMHAMWRVSTEDTAPLLQAHSQQLLESFSELISERILPIDMIWKVVILAHGALWRHRSTRHPTRNLTHGNRLASAIAIESHIATHILDLHRVLLKIGTVQMGEGLQEDGAKQDLAQSITAVFRRELPALRLAGKWLRANIKYVLEQSRADATGRVEANGSIDVPDRRTDKRQEYRRRSNIPNVTIGGAQDFWQAYAEFSTTALSMFPVGNLPALSVLLDEDRETTGFLPLKRTTSAETGSTATNNASPNGAQGTHPNAEFLMRIHELLLDARALAGEENAPFVFANGRFVLNGEPSHGLLPANGGASNEASIVGSATESDLHDVAPIYGLEHTSLDDDEDDDGRTEITRTDDDPVTLAFREALKTDSEEEEEEDRIVYPRADYPDPGLANQSPHIYATPRNPPMSSPAPLSPRLPRSNSPLVSMSGPSGMAPISPPRHVPISPPRHAPISPPRHAPINGSALPPPGVSKAQGTTAEDLLRGLRRYSAHTRTPSAPQAPLLFGSGNTASIWSTECDRGSLSYRSAPINPAPYPSHQYQSPPSLSSLPPTFSPERSQSQLVDTASLSYPSQPPYPQFRGHQRISSLNLGLSQGLTSQGTVPQFSVSGGFAPLPEAQSALYQTGVPSAYVNQASLSLDPILGRPHSPPMYQTPTAQRMLDTRIGRPPPILPPAVPTAARLWSNHG